MVYISLMNITFLTVLILMKIKQERKVASNARYERKGITNQVSN
jgi:hypothetical protein